MIHVEVDPSQIPQDWLDRAAAVTKTLAECADEDDSMPPGDRKSAHDKRRAIIDGNSGLWGELKPILLGWSHGKCWYSELKDDGSDYHVDHFRPKNRVRNEGEAVRDGYWWLAFDWTNYRISVAWCNSLHGAEDGPARGKADQFPLKLGSEPVLTPEGDVRKEDRVFLDPLDPDDAVLVDFDENGVPVPTVEGWHAERVLRTRNLLHLEAIRMVEARQAVWRQCEELAVLIATSLAVPTGEHRPRDREASHRAMSLLAEKLRPDAPLSAVAMAYVLKCNHPWARRLIRHPLSRVGGGALTAVRDIGAAVDQGLEPDIDLG